MSSMLIIFGILFYKAAHSHESDSGEANRIEVSPFYDTIIFSDVADIISEFENNLNNPIDALISGSESDENIEDLLAEYQHYLDKAHKQRLSYYEKTKTKNKVPLIRHDRYTKTKPPINLKYDDNYYSNTYYSSGKGPQTPINNPLDIFLPISSKLKFINKPEVSASPSREPEDFATFQKRLIDIPSGVSKVRHEPVKPSCYCKNGQYPCDCKCKQCLVSFDAMPMPQNYFQHSKVIPFDSENKALLQNSEYSVDDRLRDANDNTLNIRIKVDIQLPKTQEVIGRMFKNRSRDDDVNSKEATASTLNLPFPYFNFPIPMDLFGYKRSSKYKHESPLHKITIHKKKKSRQSSGSKKHRKKLITIHNLNIEPQQSLKNQSPNQSNFEERYNLSDYSQKSNYSNLSTQDNIKATVTEKIELTQLNFSEIANKTDEPLAANEAPTEESIFLMVNISNNSDNLTEEAHKTENSVEAEYPKVDLNIPPQKISNLRKKRETSTNKNVHILNEPTTNAPPIANSTTMHKSSHVLKSANNTTMHKSSHVLKSANNTTMHKSSNVLKSANNTTMHKNSHVLKSTNNTTMHKNSHVLKSANNTTMHKSSHVLKSANNTTMHKNSHVLKSTKQTSKKATEQVSKKTPTKKIPRKETTMEHPTAKNPPKKVTSKKPAISVQKKQNITKLEHEHAITARSTEAKKSDKSLYADTELLYWPDNIKIKIPDSSKNITTIILERETKKAKLNMTKETIRHNRTRALERAIFGDVNWDDVDTVAPVFMSFVGKYMRGVLTFCSQNICHSMKCAEKTCVHRTCAPNDRWNHRGHCAGSTKTDSVASLESIMDLPSNIAFEIVDILQDKMLGKLFGKATMCISSKCITFVTSKKNFLKSKCSNKELNKTGHCPNVKNVKIV